MVLTWSNMGIYVLNVSQCALLFTHFVERPGEAVQNEKGD